MVEKEYFISVDSGHVDVQQEMNEVLKRYNNGYVTGVIDNVIIELFISNPDVPCLDLVDMPGLIQNAADNEPDFDLSLKMLVLDPSEYSTYKKNGDLDTCGLYKRVYYHGYEEQPVLWEESVEVLVEEVGEGGQQRRVLVVDLTLAHVCHLK